MLSQTLRLHAYFVITINPSPLGLIEKRALHSLFAEYVTKDTKARSTVRDFELAYS